MLMKIRYKLAQNHENWLQKLDDTHCRILSIWYPTGITVAATDEKRGFAAP